MVAWPVDRGRNSGIPPNLFVPSLDRKMGRSALGIRLGWLGGSSAVDVGLLFVRRACLPVDEVKVVHYPLRNSLAGRDHVELERNSALLLAGMVPGPPRSADDLLSIGLTCDFRQMA